MDFDQCPVWYLRSPAAFASAPEGVGAQTVVSYVADQQAFLEWGALGPVHELPARLYRCLTVLAHHRAVREANVAHAAKQRSEAEARKGRRS